MITSRGKVKTLILLLLPEEFLQWDWRRTVILQFNLKYLLVKNSFSTVTKSVFASCHNFKTIVKRIPDFQTEKAQKPKYKENTKKKI